MMPELALLLLWSSAINALLVVPDSPAPGRMSIDEMDEKLLPFYDPPKKAVPINQDASFQHWLDHIKNNEETIKMPYIYIRDRFANAFTNNIGTYDKVLDHKADPEERDCRMRAVAFAFVACNRYCDRAADLMINNCGPRKIASNGIEPFEMAFLCCPERLQPPKH